RSSLLGALRHPSIGLVACLLVGQSLLVRRVGFDEGLFLVCRLAPIVLLFVAATSRLAPRLLATPHSKRPTRGLERSRRPSSERLQSGDYKPRQNDSSKIWGDPDMSRRKAQRRAASARRVVEFSQRSRRRLRQNVADLKEGQRSRCGPQHGGHLLR